ncbi:MAG: hypothetical protein AB7F74_19945 [Parvibaculaceae bacterium]
MTTAGETATAKEPQPCRRLVFTLTRADALAYETLPREIGGWRLILLFVWISFGGMAVAMLPENWVGEEGGWRFWFFIAVSGFAQYRLAMVVMRMFRFWRASRRLRHPMAVEMLDHIHHLEWREGGVPFFVAPEAINAIITTPTHAFVHVYGRILIIPARAFGSRHEMSGFAEELERRGEEA